MDREGILSARERARPELRNVANRLRFVMNAEAEIEGREYKAHRERSEKSTLYEQSVPGIAEEIQRVVDAVPMPASPRPPTADHDRKLDAYIGRLGVVANAATLSAILREAEAAGVAARVWPYVEPMLKKFAAEERFKVPHPTSAFAILVHWSTRLRTGNGAAVDGVAARAQQQRVLREAALEMCAVCGLRGAVEVALRRSAVAEQATTGGSTIIEGKYWEK